MLSITRKLVRLNQKSLVRFATKDSLEWSKSMNQTLKESDPDLYKIIENEKIRQRDSLVLIASENFTSKSVFDALGSVMSNKYSGKRSIFRVFTIC